MEAYITDKVQNRRIFDNKYIEIPPKIDGLLVSQSGGKLSEGTLLFFMQIF